MWQEELGSGMSSLKAPLRTPRHLHCSACSGHCCSCSATHGGRLKAVSEERPLLVSPGFLVEDCYTGCAVTEGSKIQQGLGVVRILPSELVICTHLLWFIFFR